MDLLDDSESGFFVCLCGALQNSRTMGKLSSETNSNTQNNSSSPSDIDQKKPKNYLCTDYRPDDQGGKSVLFLGSKQER